MSPNAIRLATQNQAPSASRSPHPRRCLVRIETDSGTFVGRVYVAHGKGRVSDVLSDERPFLNLTEVKSGEAGPAEAFVAINKRCIRTLRVLDEGETGPARV
jgi:hypothetical protein